MNFYLLRPLTPVLILLVGCSASAVEEQESEQPDTLIETRSLVVEGDADQGDDEGLSKAIADVDVDVDQVLKLQLQRHSLGVRYLREKKNALALDQFELANQYYLQHLDHLQSVKQMTASLSMLNTLFGQGKYSSRVAILLSNAIEKLREQESDDNVNAVSETIARILGMQLRNQSLSDEERQQLTATIDKEIDRFDRSYANDPTNEIAIVGLSMNLSNAALAHKDNAELAAQLKSRHLEFVTKALQENVTSTAVAGEFSDVMNSSIASTYRDNPESASDSLERALKLLQSANEQKDSHLDSQINRLSGYKSKIAAAFIVKKLIGKPHPPIEVDSWVNNESKVSLESLPGKVVLLDFWAVWCGPCIATFPHLRELHENYHAQGLEIVGVTRY